MSALRRIFSNWWVLSSLTALVLIALVVLVLPFAVELHLRTELLLVALIVLAWGAWAGWRIWRARRASDNIERKLGIASQSAERESDVLTRRMREGLAALKKDGGGKGDYLYSRPWYVMIGPPGAGKTTALLNSGLRFPPGAGERDVGGTRNIDFLFADEAVLLDTAGRYTSQDSDAARDREAWVRLLDLLKTNRPLQPVNGVIVAIGVDELASADAARIEHHAAIVEARLRELGDALQIEVPVYALFTKADLVAGFSEFYADLDVEGRRAVLGTTLPWRENAPPDADGLAEHLDELLNAVQARTSKRLQDELDLRQRSLIVGFPAQMAALRGRLLYFLDRAFTGARRHRPILLRGFYFTSGVQQGTPFDRLLSQVATLFDARPPLGGATSGRAYFINRLLKDVVIGEAGLVRRTPAMRNKERRVLLAGGGAIAFVCVAAIVLWTVSYFANRSWTSELRRQAGRAEQQLKDADIDLVQVKDSDLEIEPANDALTTLRKLRGGYDERHGSGHSFWAGFGLYESGVGEAAERAYIDAAQRVLMPRGLLNMEDRLRLGQADPLGLYGTLKAYMLTGGQKHAFEPDFVENWIADDWAIYRYPGGDHEAARDAMRKHLHVALGDRELSGIWGDNGVPLDARLLGEATRAVQSTPMEDRAYAILRQRGAGQDKQDWQVSSFLKAGNERAFAQGDELLKRSVPYFFTREGYRYAFLTGIWNVQHDLEQDSWMFGDAAGARPSQDSKSAIAKGVVDHYVRDYVAKWTDFLGSLKPADYFHDKAALRIAASSNSPIKRLLQGVAQNTYLGPSASEKVGGKLLRRMAPNWSSRVDSVSKDMKDADVGSDDAASAIEAEFQDFNEYVSGKSSPSIDDFMTQLKAAGRAQNKDDDFGTLQVGTQTPTALAQAADEFKNAADSAPPQFSGFIKAVSGESTSANTAQTATSLSAYYAQNIQPDCLSATSHLYPFMQGSAQDASLEKLEAVFGPGRALDNFTQNSLRGYIQTGASSWTWNQTAGDFAPETPSQLQKAQELRDLLASSVQMQIEVIKFGGTVTEARLTFNGGTNVFPRDGAKPAHIRWNTQLQPETKLTLLAGTETVAEIEGAPGTWSLFRLLDKSKEDAENPNRFTAQFGEGASFVILRITLEGAQSNPFSRAGLWSFRCPPRL